MTERPNFLKKQFYIPRELNQRLQQSAARKGYTESAIICEALAEYLASEQYRNILKDQNRGLRIVGAFEEDQTYGDIISNVDEQLYDLIDCQF